MYFIIYCFWQSLWLNLAIFQREYLWMDWMVSVVYVSCLSSSPLFPLLLSQLLSLPSSFSSVSFYSPSEFPDQVHTLSYLFLSRLIYRYSTSSYWVSFKSLTSSNDQIWTWAPLWFYLWQLTYFWCLLCRCFVRGSGRHRWRTVLIWIWCRLFGWTIFHSIWRLSTRGVINVVFGWIFSLRRWWFVLWFCLCLTVLRFFARRFANIARSKARIYPLVVLSVINFSCRIFSIRWWNWRNHVCSNF